MNGLSKLTLLLVMMAFSLTQSLVKAEKIITVAAYPAIDSIVKEALPEWKKNNPGVQVKIVSRQYGDHHTAMVTALATKSGLPDIMAIEYGYLGRFIKGGGMTDLSQKPFDANQYRDKFVSFAWQQAYDKDKGQGAIPTDIGPGSLFYRSDILAKAGLQESDLTDSWESFIAAGKVIKAKTNAYLLAHARDIKDIIIRTNIPTGEGVYFDANGKSVVGKAERFKRGFRLAKQVRDNQLDGKIGAWSNEWGESFKRGTVATQMMGAWLGGHLNNWLAPNTKGKWRAANLPDNAQASWGGTFYGIPKKSNNKELAWSLMQYLTMNRNQQIEAFEREDAFPALLAAQDGAFFQQPIAFLGGQKARLQWRAAANAIKPTAVFKHDAIAQEIVDNELSLVLSKGKSVDKALRDADRLIVRRSRR